MISHQTTCKSETTVPGNRSPSQISRPSPICTVDDSTGVISCTCWKKTRLLENSSFAATSTHRSTVGGLNLSGMLKNLKDEEFQKSNIEIGDVISVRGVIKVFREQREIVSSVYHKVEDPACDAQIFRMLDVPHLYRNVYDVPFKSSQDNDSSNETTTNVTHQLSEQVEDFLTKNTIQNFYPRELETVDSLMSLVSGKLRESQVNQSCPTTKEVRSLFTDAIGLLQKRGVVFLKSQKHDVYHTTDQDKELHKTTLGIIQADCRRHRHVEKGCHILHILNCVRQAYSSGVSEAVMKRVLNTLESESHIVSTMELHYTVF
ncbi:CST complex subunit STN1 isoform X2 [Pleurodeles waltl]|uniref:CST complex subunit STN1 isoform X2 n=1 Tax=Pleurodeles waltl TaxID=8319 RepID=UPI0037094560